MKFLTQLLLFYGTALAIGSTLTILNIYVLFYEASFDVSLAIQYPVCPTDSPIFVISATQFPYPYLMASYICVLKPFTPCYDLYDQTSHSVL